MRTAIVAILLLALRPPFARPEEHGIQNVLLVSIDSLRADRLGAYGNPRPASPTIDRLAAEGVRFERALSPTSWTLPAHATLLSGEWQRTHQVITTADRLSPGSESLAEAFAGQGYETVGFYSGPFLDPAYGFARGFERYESCLSDTTAGLEGEAEWNSSHSDRTNPCIGGSFIRWAAHRSSRPFFAFVHMWDVHYDYIPPEPFASMFDPDYHGPLDGREIMGQGFPLDAGPRDVLHLLALYDGELRFTDATLARMLAALDQHGALDRTLVIITSDHGEEFLEHGGKGHQQTLWNEVLHVPLIAWARSGLPPTAISEPVSLADVAPTIVELVGLPGMPPANGRSLVPLIHGDTSVARPVFSTLYYQGVPKLRLIAVQDRMTKVIHDPNAGTWAQFDLAADPHEKRPLPANDAALCAELTLRESEALKALAARGQRPSPVQLPPATVERLRALGYVL